MKTVAEIKESITKAIEDEQMLEDAPDDGDVEHEVERLVDKYLGGKTDNKNLINKARNYIEKGKRIGFNVGAAGAATAATILGAAGVSAGASGDQQMAQILLGLATASIASPLVTSYAGKKIGSKVASSKMKRANESVDLFVESMIESAVRR